MKKPYWPLVQADILNRTVINRIRQGEITDDLTIYCERLDMDTRLKQALHQISDADFKEYVADYTAGLIPRPYWA
jgi:hypothetical protein